MSTLSNPARWTLLFGPPALLLITAWQSPQRTFCLPLISAPTILAVYIRSRTPPELRGRTETCLWTWIFSSTIGVGIVILLQLVLGYSVAYSFHGDGMDAFVADWINPEPVGTTEDMVFRASRAWSLPVVWQRVLFTFGGAGLFEEMLKYAPVHMSEERGFACVYYTVFAGLGFGFFESYAAMQGDIGRRFVQRVLLGATGHVLSAALTGLRAVGRTRSVWAAIAPSAFYHGLWDFALLSLSEMEGNVGWVEPKDSSTLSKMLIAITAVWIACGTQVWLEWRKITL